MRGLTLDALNPNFHNVSYAVRGELAIKAEALRDELKDPSNKLPFDKVISSNIGNPQQQGLDQKPITFTRQVSTSRFEYRNLTYRARLQRSWNTRNWQS